MTSLNLEYIFLKLYELIFQHKISDIGSHLVGVRNFFAFVLSLLSIICITVIIYSAVRLKERRAADLHKMHDAIHAAGEHHHDEHEDKRWKMVLDFITSENPSDWRLAIIEADNILDDLLKEIGFPGNDTGERLKNAPPSHFKTINEAWDAHKVRNRIAHDGMSFDLSYREAKKAIESYEKVFTEFDYI